MERWKNKSRQSSRSTSTFVFLLANLVFGLCASYSNADFTEVREYTVQVDGKPVGNTQLTITDRNDGTTVVQNRANVQVKFIITYSYSYQGTEVWNKAQLLQLRGQCDDNRKRFNVQANYDPNNKQIQVSGSNGEYATPDDTWSTSYWRLPDAKLFNQGVRIIDADRGKLIQGQLQYVGTEQRQIAGKDMKTYHFRVTGKDQPIDLWYDVHHRLVRQEFVELRHRTVIEMTNIQRGQ